MDHENFTEAIQPAEQNNAPLVLVPIYAGGKMGDEIITNSLHVSHPNLFQIVMPFICTTHSYNCTVWSV